MRTFESGGTWARPAMTNNTEDRLRKLRLQIEAALDRVHDEAIAKFRTLAKSTGQRTRADRL